MLNSAPHLPVYGQWPMSIVSGKDCLVVDQNGNEYLDMYGGHAVASIGHCHPHLVSAISEQSSELIFYSNAADISIRQKFIEKLVEYAPSDLGNVFLCNSGAEANENALTLARLYRKRKKVVSFEGGFHGRSLLTLAISGIESYRRKSMVSDSMLFEHSHCIPFNDTGLIDDAIDEDCCAVIIEPVQGLGGARAASLDFLQALRQRCDETGAVLIFDEVQCGSGRCGRYTASEAFDVKPDIITLAKGIAGGFPIGAVLVREEVASVTENGSLGTTFGGGPLACAAGLATLEVLESEHLLENCRKVGDLLKNRLKTIPGILEVSGLGLLIGIRSEKPAGEVSRKLIEEFNILAGSSIDPQVLRIMPPLTLSFEMAERFIDAMSKILI